MIAIRIAAALEVRKPGGRRSIRYQTYDDEDDEAVADALDGGAGTWTRLQLIEMDLAFCAAMRRAHPELELHEQPWRSAA
jgi:hypothetical protein